MWLWKDESGELVDVGEMSVLVFGERMISVSCLPLLDRRNGRLLGNLKPAFFFFCCSCFCFGVVGSLGELLVGITWEKGVLES